MAVSGRFIGRSLKRKEDPKYLKGLGTYVDDIKLPGMLYLAVLRSPHPHALIKKIEAGDALKAKNVKEVLTGKEAARLSEPLICMFQPQGVKIPKQYCLATDRVRFVGEAVAAVAAEDRYSAYDATELINVDYERLPPVIDAVEAVSSGTILHEEVENNVYHYKKIQAGDVEAAFNQADLVVEEKLKIHRQAGSPLEPRGIISYYDSNTGSLTVWASTQTPNALRMVLSHCLRIPASRIRVIVKDMGGGFGNYKYHPEDVITSLMSVKTGRPVKWVASRRELLLAGYHSREQTHFVKAGFSRDGRIKGLQDRIFADMGAYLTREATGPAVVTSHMLPGPYDIRNISIELFCVATNKSYSSAYRGFGQPEAAFVMERLIDLAAAELDVDPSEVRLRNFVQPEQMPYRSPTGVVHDNANFSDCLKHALKLMDYVNLKRVYRSQSNRCLGLGMAFYVELTGFGPARVAGITGAVHGGYESMTLRFDVSGQATIFTGLVPHGQGSETTLSQVAAELLGLDFEDVRIVYGDTDITPYGLGTFGSRNAVVGSGAVYKLADALIKKGVKVAANILEAVEDDIDFKDGFFYVKGVPGKRLHIKEIAKRAILAVGLPSDVEPGFEASVSYDPGSWTNTWGVHVALVEVDPETGKVDILKYVIVDDSGTLINPMIVEGQVVGGAVQGIGGTLLEELSYDSDGHLISSTFMDYLIPSAADCPPFLIEHMETKAKTNPLGVKGVGESGIIPTSAALANAVEDALRNYGVKVRETPLTAYKIHSLIKKSG